jgi:hypothetical protein
MTQYSKHLIYYHFFEKLLYVYKDLCENGFRLYSPRRPPLRRPGYGAETENALRSTGVRAGCSFRPVGLHPVTYFLFTCGGIVALSDAFRFLINTRQVEPAGFCFCRPRAEGFLLATERGAKDGDERRSVQKPRPPYERPPPGR